LGLFGGLYWILRSLDRSLDLNAVSPCILGRPNESRGAWRNDRAPIVRPPLAASHACRSVAIAVADSNLIVSLNEPFTVVMRPNGRADSLCATLAVLPVNANGETTERFDIVIDPARSAPSGELLRVDDRLSDGDSDRFKFRDLFVRGLLPLVEGCGQNRFVWNEITNSLVILPPEPIANSRLSHIRAPYASGENAAPSA
jgi:hypothetical protein